VDKIKIIHEARHSSHSLYAYFFAQGILFAALGLMVVFYPGLLVLLAAFFFVLIGIASIWIGMRIRRIVKKIDSFLKFF